jgi:uncharacterized protein YukE
VGAVADGSQADRIAMALARIRMSVGTIDELWRGALATGAGGEAIEFGDASQALHRALIALSSHERHVANRDSAFSVEWSHGHTVGGV